MSSPNLNVWVSATLWVCPKYSSTSLNNLTWLPVKR